jgi:hypothetical protein
MDSLEECRQEFPIFYSLVANTSNHLLWGDWDKGEYGVLVRSFDLFDNGGAVYKEALEDRDIDTTEMPTLHFLPASFLHASIRASGAIFTGEREDTFTILVGTKYKKNWAMKEFQVNGTVDCQTYYPQDAGTIGRGVLEDPKAIFCRPDQSDAVCVNETCLADSDSACGGCKLPGAMFGDHIAKFAEQENTTFQGLTYFSCWYPKSRHGMKNMVTAANSIWKERNRWQDTSDLEDYDLMNYSGWTECTATRNIGTTEMVDAIVIPLLSAETSICEYCDLEEDCDQGEIQAKLQFAYDRGYGSLPVLFYREIEGMQEPDCERLWGGIECEDGYRKNFFSQEYKFKNGACVHRPPGCEEAYYFPPQDVNASKAGCSAFSEDGAKRIELLCSSERGTPLVIDAGSSMESLEGTKPTTAWRLETSTGNSRAYIFHAAAVVLFLLTRRRRLPREARRGSLSRTTWGALARR